MSCCSSRHAYLTLPSPYLPHLCTLPQAPLPAPGSKRHPGRRSSQQLHATKRQRSAAAREAAGEDEEEEESESESEDDVGWAPGGDMEGVEEAGQQEGGKRYVTRAMVRGQAAQPDAAHPVRAALGAELELGLVMLSFMLVHSMLGTGCQGMSADWLLPLDWLLLSSACTADPATAAFTPPLQPLLQALPGLAKPRPREAGEAPDQQGGEPPSWGCSRQGVRGARKRAGASWGCIWRLLTTSVGALCATVLAKQAL